MVNRALCWNPQTAEIIGKVRTSIIFRHVAINVESHLAPSSQHWTFQVIRRPRNPDLLAAAYLDGTIGIHSLQSTSESVEGSQGAALTPRPDDSDVFDVPGLFRATQSTLLLKQPPNGCGSLSRAHLDVEKNLLPFFDFSPAQGKNRSSSSSVR